MVGLEGDRASVVGPGVGLDYEALRAPEEVNFVAADLGIDLGGGDAVTTEQREEGDLEVRARAVGLDALEAQTLELGLADRAADEVGGDGRRGAEVFDRARDGGDGDVVAVGGEGGRG